MEEAAQLQSQIDDAAENLKLFESTLESIKTQLKVLNNVTSEESVKSAAPPTAQPPVVVVDSTAHAAKSELSPEEMQLRERAIRCFNLNPHFGVPLLKECCGGTSHLPAFFIGTPGINKARLGDWLGETHEENVQTLASFAFAFAFTGQSFEQALRMYCSKFRMPLESKKIDRIMEAFANAFFSMNPRGLFASVDAVHILSFSCVMLNADVHRSEASPTKSSNSHMGRAVKSIDTFVAQHRGVNGGSDLPRTLIESLFQSLHAHELAVPVELAPGLSEPGVLFTSPLKAGWMRKQGGRHKAWARRFFVLSARTLFYFEGEGEVDPRGFFPLENLFAQVTKKQVTLLPTGGLEMVRSAKFNRAGEMAIGNHKTLLLAAPSEAEAAEWAELLNRK